MKQEIRDKLYEVLEKSKDHEIKDLIYKRKNSYKKTLKF